MEKHKKVVHVVCQIQLSLGMNPVISVSDITKINNSIFQ